MMSALVCESYSAALIAVCLAHNQNEMEGICITVLTCLETVMIHQITAKEENRC